MVERPCLIATLAAVALSVSPAAAESTTAVMAVTAEVSDTCTVSAGPMTFALDDDGRGRGAAPARAQADIALSCTPRTGFAIAMNAGDHADGVVRRMRDPSTGAHIVYEIYSDAARTARWGDRAEVDTVDGLADGSGAVHLAAYGEIRPTASIAPGSYSDSIVITVNF